MSLSLSNNSRNTINLAFPDRTMFPCLMRSMRGDIVLVSDADMDGNHHVTYLLIIDVPDPKKLMGRSYSMDKANLERSYLPCHLNYSIQLTNASDEFAK